MATWVDYFTQHTGVVHQVPGGSPDIGEVLVLGWGGSRASIWVLGELTASRSGYAKGERSGLILIQAAFSPSPMYLSVQAIHESHDHQETINFDNA